MNIKKECEGKVIIVEDFLSKEETYNLDSFMRYFNYEGLKDHEFVYWGKRLINESQMQKNPGYEHVMDDILPMLNDMLKRTAEILNQFDHEAEWEPSPYNLIKMYQDSSPLAFQDDDKLEMFVHIDNQGHMEKPILWGSVVYPNDDYEGGEIYYPDYEFWYKPKPGSLVLHEGNTRHGVKKVASGNRYCAASLTTIAGLYNQNPLPTRTDDPENPYFYPPGYWGKRMPDDPIQEDVKRPRGDGSFADYNNSPRLGKADGGHD
jgi:hypothetical protein